MKIIVVKKLTLYIFLVFLILLFTFLLFILFPDKLYIDTNSYISINEEDLLKTLNDTDITYLQDEIDSLYSSDKKIAYLTFDDGPTKKATSKILNILAEEDVSASFFVIGEYVNHHPELVKRAFDEGHYIANHTYHHSNSKLYKSPTDFVNEIKNTDIEIGKAIGISDYSSHLFRFPNGYMSSIYKKEKKWATSLLSDMNYLFVDWNCLNRDSEKVYSPVDLLKNLKSSAKDKGSLVILMHDTCDLSDTPSALKDSISYLKSQGYEFHNFYDFFNQYLLK